MLSAEQTPSSGCDNQLGEGNDLPEKRQYTVKGLEADAVTLMRDAARKDGMKIGAWVSARMKEAAFRSLNHTRSKDISRDDINSKEEMDLKDLVYALYRDRLEAESKLLSIQAELHEITSSQRTIMAKMLQIIG